MIIVSRSSGRYLTQAPSSSLLGCRIYWRSVYTKILLVSTRSSVTEASPNRLGTKLPLDPSLPCFPGIPRNHVSLISSGTMFPLKSLYTMFTLKSLCTMFARKSLGTIVPPEVSRYLLPLNPSEPRCRDIRWVSRILESAPWCQKMRRLSKGCTRWVSAYREIVDAILFHVNFDGNAIWTVYFSTACGEMCFRPFEPSR